VSIDRRNPYRPFDPAVIEDFLGGRTLLSARLLPLGKSNTNYQLSLSDGCTCLLRLRSQGSPGQESRVMNLARELVPVPEEIHRGDTWSVFTFLEGNILRSVPQYTAKAAEALAKISSVRFESSGWIGQDGSVSPFEFGGIRGYLSKVLADVQVQFWVDPPSTAAIQAILRHESGRLDDLQNESRLVHGDFNPTNILIHQGAISGILDWEYCHAGTRYMDIGNLLRNTSSKYHGQIRMGLEAGGMKLPHDWKKRARLVDLCSQLEFLTSARSDRFKQRCVIRIQDFLIQDFLREFQRKSPD